MRWAGYTAAMTARNETNAAHRNVVEATEATQRTMRPQQVPVRMYEASEALVIVAPMPAVTAEDVTIELNGPHLRFRAALRSAPARDYLLDEWEFGGYERELTLPDGYGSAAEATLNNGQLAIRVMPGSTAEPLVLHPTA